MQGESFGDFLKKNGLVPPDMMDYDENEVRKDYDEKMADPSEKFVDHEEDTTGFEIMLINKRNMGLVFDSKVHNGEIMFDRVLQIPKDATEWLNKGTWLDKMWKKKDNSQYGLHHGPRFVFLSENLQ